MEQTPQPEFREDLSLKNEDVYPGAAWRAPEYHHIDKSRDWYWGVGIVGLTAVVLSFLLSDWLFGLLIFVGAITLVIFAHRPPRTIEIQMGTTGILVDKRLYEYKDLESFFIEIEDNPQHPKILFKSKKTWMPLIIVPLGEMNPYDVADFLAAFLHEEDLKEPLLQRIAEDFGF